MTKGAGTNFDNRLSKTIKPSLIPGQSLHIMTTDAYGQWVLNLRLHRNTPSMSGYTGYTKQGFMLTRDETRELANSLMDLVANDELWIDNEEGVEDIDD
mgnify:CR=1 FL=1